MIGKLLNIRPLRAALEPMLFQQTLRAAEQFEEGDPCDPRHYMMMIRRFCSTNGVSQDQLHEVMRKKRPKPELESWPLQGVAGEFDREQVGEAVAALNKDGFYRFPNLLPDDLVDQLRELALTTECGRNRPAPEGDPETMMVDLENPITDTYHVPKPAVLSCPAGQKLIADEVFLAIASEYFNSRPVFSSVSQWWSFPHSTKGDTAVSAQEYHFDMDRIKWLKFFVYLTDVTPETGAHYFVRGTHRSGSQPEALRRKDYRRISDDEIAQHFAEEDIVQMSGPKGAMFVEDTRGYHKGNPLQEGHRLVIDVEYADSLFGTNYDQLPVSDPQSLLRSDHVKKHYSDLYARCDFVDADS